MAIEPENTPAQSVQSRYAEQVAADLAANQDEQVRIDAQIAELEERRGQLREDAVLLERVRASLLEELTPGGAGPAGAGAAEASAEMTDERSAPAEDGPAPGAASAEDHASETAGQAGASTARAARSRRGKRGAKAVPADSGTKTVPKARLAVQDPPPAQPPLNSLVLDLLGKTDEPRMAGEVFTELLKEYPERLSSGSAAQQVRNALERLVAKSMVERIKQQGSVMYTVRSGSEGTPNQASDQSAQAPVGDDVEVGV